VPSDAEGVGSTAAVRTALPRVMIVTASARRRGAELQATQLSTELRRRGASLVLAALTGAGGAMALPMTVLGRRRLGPSTLRRLRRAAHDVDVVIAYGSSTLPACVIALAGSGTPFVYRNISDPGYWVRNRLHRAVTGFQYRRAAMVVALWPGAATAVARLFRVRSERIVVIPNARDPRAFRPPTAGERDRARESLELGDRPTIAFVGSISREKRPELAIAAISRMPGYVLVVVGDGPLRAEAQQQASAEAPGRVMFLGEVGEVIRVLHAVDAVVITSEAEGMPGVAIEAAMCGVPVVATDAGALSEMPGVQIVERDPASLAEALTGVIGQPAPSEVSEFGWPKVADRWVELLTQMTAVSIGSRPSGR
jgi:glycosyltransferase involved in cell wall biosynthesis